MARGSHRGLNPPAYFLAGLVAIIALALRVPSGSISSPVFEVAGVILIAVGVWLNVRGSTQFERAGTPIRPGSCGGALVTEGVFRLSRNPMYLGLASILFGAGLGLGSVAGLVVTPLFVGSINARFIPMEERILEEEFGEAYDAYRVRVRRWI